MLVPAVAAAAKGGGGAKLGGATGTAPDGKLLGEPENDEPVGVRLLDAESGDGSRFLRGDSWRALSSELDDPRRNGDTSIVSSVSIVVVCWLVPTASLRRRLLLDEGRLAGAGVRGVTV